MRLSANGDFYFKMKLKFSFIRLKIIKLHVRENISRQADFRIKASRFKHHFCVFEDVL